MASCRQKATLTHFIAPGNDASLASWQYAVLYRSLAVTPFPDAVLPSPAWYWEVQEPPRVGASASLFPAPVWRSNRYSRTVALHAGLPMKSEFKNIRLKRLEK